jgi:hypothetical protein
MSSSGRWNWKSETSTSLDYRREFDGGSFMCDSPDLTLRTEAVGWGRPCQAVTGL